MYQIQISRLRLLALACLAVASFGLSTVANADCVGMNTCFGEFALSSNTTGSQNSAFGTEALRQNNGFNNTAVGETALRDNLTGVENSALGNGALENNTTGVFNTAAGSNALKMNTIGNNNTAVGQWALLNSLGNKNTALGAGALAQNWTGNNNTATGHEALLGDLTSITGSNNTANGYQSLFNNSSGEKNTAIGSQSLLSNTSGNYNTATGNNALRNATTGFRNVALGHRAGQAITTGSDNIIIGGDNQGTAADSGVIRIGRSANQKKTFVAGIRGIKTGLTGAVAVLIDANGQLGTVNSSREVKEDILPMEDVSERLLALRPVTFRYKQADEDGSKPIQFGLIAEEVAQSFPELVVYDANGKPETVSYHLLATLLLNEVQKQRIRVAALEEQSGELARLKKEVATMAEVIARLDQARMVATTH